MKSTILDSSALLAFLKGERGAEKVEAYFGGNIIMSALNYSEVIATLEYINTPLKKADSLLSELVEDVVSFDKEQAIMAAALRKDTKSQGLSLGDRACIALGIIKNCPIVTADRAWAKIETKADIQLIR